MTVAEKQTAPKERDPKSAAKVPKDPADKKGLEARAALARDTAQEIQALRGVFSDILEIYRSRVDGQLAGLAEAFREAGQDGNPPPARACKAILEQIRALKVKPRKGRGKDLARVEALAECLWELLPPGR